MCCRGIVSCGTLVEHLASDVGRARRARDARFPASGLILRWHHHAYDLAGLDVPSGGSRSKHVNTVDHQACRHMGRVRLAWGRTTWASRSSDAATTRCCIVDFCRSVVSPAMSSQKKRHRRSAQCTVHSASVLALVAVAKGEQVLTAISADTVAPTLPVYAVARSPHHASNSRSCGNRLLCRVMRTFRVFGFCRLDFGGHVRWNSRHGYAIDTILPWVTEDAQPDDAMGLRLRILSKGCSRHRLDPARWRTPRHPSHCLSPRRFLHSPFENV
jgi:hypothetical protein